jgi:hypothetical protein
LLLEETPEALEILSIADSQPHQTQNMIGDMRDMISGEGWKESGDSGEDFRVNSLESIILQCQRVEKVEVGVQFISMINFIQLVAKVERYFYLLQALNFLLNFP